MKWLRRFSLFSSSPTPEQHAQVLIRALRSAIAAHRSTQVRTLLTEHGARAFAGALAHLSGRSMADALSLLSATEQAQVRRHLPLAARQRLQAVFVPMPLRAQHAAMGVTP